MKIHRLSVAEALASVQSSQCGLASAEALRRLHEYGPNAVQALPGEPLWRRFLKGLTHFLAIVLWLAAALAFFAAWQQPGGGMATLGWAIVGVILVNAVFAFWQEHRAERALAALQRLLPHRVTVRRDGTAVSVPASDLVPGDVIALQAGDQVPADCRVIESFALRVNNATVTGESVPQSRDAGSSDEPEFLHAENVLLAGTWVMSGEAVALVCATGQHTVFGQIAHLTQQRREPLSPLQQEIARLSRWVAFFAVGLGVVFFAVGHALGLSFWGNLLFAIGIIVANVPEGLLPTVTLALALGSQRMARRKALVRHLPAVETLGAASAICTDKTGTLTRNCMTAKQLFVGGRRVAATDSARLRLLVAEHRRFFETAWFCHNVKEGRAAGHREWLGDPTEIALVQMACEADLGNPRYPRLDEIPFDSRRRRFSTVQQTPDGPVLFLKGAPEVVLTLCRDVALDGSPVPLTGELKARFMAAQNAMAEEGLRVLAFAHRVLPEGCEREHFEERLTLTGLVGLEDPPRPEVPAAIARCREAGIKVIMVTGDHPHTALAIAREIGLAQAPAPVVITGDTLRHLSNTQLQLALDAPEILFARVGADQKLRIVSALKRKQHIVAVTGDGVNDAPALKQADIGIAMGLTGTDVARESADMILLDDNFATIVAAVEEGRAIFANIRKFLTYILTSNIPEIVPYLAFVLFRLPLPLTIIQILAVDLGTDLLPALALGAEKPDDRTMKSPPRPAHERLLNWPLIARAYAWLGPMQAAAAMTAFFYVLHQGGWRHGEALETGAPLYLQATTACLSAIVVMQIVNVFLCRSRMRSVFTSGLLSNRLILWGITVEAGLILLIDYTPWGNRLFGTAPIPAEVWLLTVSFAAAMLILEELRKWIARRHASRRR